VTLPPAEVLAAPADASASVPAAPAPESATTKSLRARTGWFDRLRQGLRKTGGSIAQVFTGTRIDDDLYEELEAALLMADTGVKATEHLLQDLKRRVKDAKATEPAQVKALLIDAVTDLLAPLRSRWWWACTNPR
jgi:fused signal recognition particle receptor